MKKLFYYFFSALIAVSFSATMLSCGDNDDDVKPTSQQPKDGADDGRWDAWT